MVNDMRALLHEAAANPPADDLDLAAVLRSGRRRVRRHRVRVGAGTALAVAGAVAVTALVGSTDSGRDTPAASSVPRPDGPVIGLADAGQAHQGVDYELVAQHANEDLDVANGQYYDGVTDDGLILFRDGPRGTRNKVRLALLDPATGDWQRLPGLAEKEQTWPLELGRERLALASIAYDDTEPFGGTLRAHVFDRTARAWTTVTWPGLPRVSGSRSPVIGTDGRIYVGVPATQGSPPPGGWPTGPDGEADDAGAEGETYDLWSVSLADSADVRDEGLRYGALAFTDDAMVWSETTNGTNDRIHVRDLQTGAQHDFDPRSGERCNLLGLGASGDRIVLSQYCGTYRDGRDDRVQILTTGGDPVTTIQGDGIDGAVVGELVEVTSHMPKREGTYVYDLADDRLLRVTDSLSSYALGGPVPDGYLMWHTAYGERQDPMRGGGAVQTLARWTS